MYAAQANSPFTTITGDLDTTATSFSVVDPSVFPAELPFLLTLGFDTTVAETVLVTAVSGGTVTCTRGVDGTLLSWPAATKVARVFNAKDLNDVQANIRTLKQALEDAAEELQDDIDTRIKICPTFTGATDIASVVEYALDQDILQTPFAFRVNHAGGSTATGYFGESSFDVICDFSSANYGRGIMFSESTRSFATFIVTNGVAKVYMYSKSEWERGGEDISGLLDSLKEAVSTLSTKVGSDTLDTTAQDLSGAINEHEDDLDALRTKVGSATLNTTAKDLSGAINEHESDIIKLTSRTDIVPGIVTLTNSKEFPFNNSVQTVAISPVRENANYIVDYHVTAAVGNVGDIVVTDKLLNGFKIEFTGSATSVTIKYQILGGMN